jgi:hypothetical protein
MKLRGGRPRLLLAMAALATMGALVLVPSAGGAARAPARSRAPVARAVAPAPIIPTGVVLASAAQQLPADLCSGLLRVFRGQLPTLLARRCGPPVPPPPPRQLPPRVCERLLRILNGHVPVAIARRCASA